MTLSIAKHSKKPIVIAGYYGFGNIGDEAVLTAILADLRASIPGAEFVVISNDPPATEKNYNVRSVYWKDYSAVIQALEQAELLILGGGGLFNSYLEYDPAQLLTPTELFSVFTFGLPLLARLLHKQCMIYAVGASYLGSENAQAHVRLAVELATICTVRDAYSKTRLEILGCNPARIQVTADPAFNLPVASRERVNEIFTLEGIPFYQPRFGVNIRYWAFGSNPSDWVPLLTTVLEEAARRYNLHITFIPFHVGSDLPQLSNDIVVINEIASALRDSGVPYNILKGNYQPAEIAGVVSTCDLFLGMRFHSCLFALANHVPCVGLVYEPKVATLFSSVGLEQFALDLSQLRIENLRQAIERIWAEASAIRELLKERVPTLRAQAHQNAHLAAKLWKTEPEALPSIPVQMLEQFALKQTRLLTQTHRELCKLQSDQAAVRKAVRMLVETRQFTTAQTLLEHLLQSNVSDAEYNYLIAFCLHNEHLDLQRALHHYTLALEGGYDEFWVRYNRGNLLHALGNLTAAHTDLERALKLQPDNVAVRTSYLAVMGTLAHQAIAAGEYATALPWLTELVHAEPERGEWHYLLGFALHNLKQDLTQALEHYTLALQYGYDEFWVRYNRGNLLHALGNLTAARIDLERAIALNPEHVGARQIFRQILEQEKTPDGN